MKQFKDFKAERSASGRETLPAGGYVCQIVGAKVEANDWGETLVVAHDVCEGEFEGIFKRDYEQNTMENKKWRGTFRLRLPKDDGSEQDAWKKRGFNNFIWAVEQSNPGFTWDWHEEKLKGKKVGLLYRNKEWEYNGKTGWTTEAAGSESVENIRNGKYRVPKDKELPLGKKAATLLDADRAFAVLDGDDEDLPF